MKVKNKYRYDYLALNLRAKVVVRFRAFSKKVARSHAETLTAMMDFFEWHNYSPHQRFAKDLSAGQELNRKRIEAHIAISKSIEKAHNIPLTNIETMLKSLFEEENKKIDLKAIEAEISKEKTSKTKQKNTSVSKIKYDRTNRKLLEIKERLQYVLDKIEPVSNRFGKDFLKIEITREELARFKQMAKDS
ncbi:BfmA/BtgA family mobilization protein [Eudoraea chungangensis]|uniref:BfmA/BtgA family mobilization protein n=1 Tax=Eudoraea chungangensis TaxID=1481905 RepID=UPI0023EA9549|nr:BfmA/BtgA family mobilization protein [Eudoraea chungangensis]